MNGSRSAEKLTFELIGAILGSLSKLGSLSWGRLKKHMAREGVDLASANSAAEAQRVIYYLKQRGLVRKLEGRGDAAVYVITTRGLSRLESLKFTPLSAKAAGWDGKWRVLIFDIPEEKKAARDVLRRLIRELGFQPLQKSVWIAPYDCRAEIDLIQKAYGVKEDITLLEVTKFDQMSKFQKMFFGGKVSL